MSTTPNEPLHAHIETAAADCDGPLYKHYVFTPTEAEKESQFGELEFRDRVLGSMVSWYPMEGAEVTVKITRDGFDCYEPTDEGYRSSTVRWCEDPDCNTSERGQRDVFAEQMGY